MRLLLARVEHVRNSVTMEFCLTKSVVISSQKSGETIHCRRRLVRSCYFILYLCQSKRVSPSLRNMNENRRNALSVRTRSVSSFVRSSLLLFSNNQLTLADEKLKSGKQVFILRSGDRQESEVLEEEENMSRILHTDYRAERMKGRNQNHRYAR